MEGKQNRTSLSMDWGSFSAKCEFCLVTVSDGETKEGQAFRGISGFYSISGAVDTAVIFSVHLAAVKCEVVTAAVLFFMLLNVHGGGMTY